MRTSPLPLPRVSAAVLALAVLAAAQEPPQAGKKAPSEAEKSGRRQPTLTLEEDHRLFFERAILSCAQKDLRPTDFTIGYEREKVYRKRGGSLIEVRIEFQRDQKPLPLSRSFVQEVIRAVETTGDSPWRLSQLRMEVTPSDPSLWHVEDLVFRRGTGGVLDDVVGGPTGVFDAFVATLDVVEKQGVDCSVTSINISQRQARRGQAPHALLTVDYLVAGERFRRDYVKIEKVLMKAIDDPDHPFAEFERPTTEKIVKADEPFAASYRVSLRVRGER